ncbi:MAG: EAL domain-containing protein [Alphaproteobacteria bacterium]|uniref:EAL domain-containing protein n=1 Tax=Candidatus Nitrobium versatile TaxID=2884831 RepID=A0A953JCL1_9BACT|nr:EAL domain-containing protein [Candidatus Nitrobium versatile]
MKRKFPGSSAELERKLKEAYEELEESQRLAHVGSWSWTIRSDTITWSRELYRIFGRDPDLPPPPFKEHAGIFTPESFARLHTAVQQAMQTGGPYELDLEIVRPDGTRRWGVAIGKAERDAGGHVERLSGIVQDITERKQVEEALRESEERLRLFIEHAPAALAMFDRQMRYLNASLRWITDYGLDDRDVRGLSHYEVFPEIPERWKAVHRRALAGEVVRADADRFERADGSEQWLRWEVRPWYNAAGDQGGIVIFSEDITDLRRAEEELRNSEATLRLAIESTGLGMFDFNPLTGKMIWSDLTKQHFGLPPDADIDYKVLLSGLHPEDRERVDTIVRDALKPASGGSFSTEFRAIGIRDRKERWIAARGKAFFNEQGYPVRFIGTTLDVSERKKAEETIKYQAYHDLLTGLPNRAQLLLRLGFELAQAQHNQKELAVLHLDLDRFRTINDTLGHTIGDKVIFAVAERLKALIRANDTLARVGSDEFIILHPDISRAEEAALFARKLVDALRKPFRIDGRELYATASIGISMYPEDSGNADVLLKNADITVSYVKERGRNNYRFFNPTLNRRTIERLLLESDLRQSIERSELVLHYQPQVRIRTGEIMCLEALVRWKHADLGVLSPGQFIPVAEEIGFVAAIDEWVLRAACSQNKAWQDAGYLPLCVTVNLSAQQFQQPALVELVSGIAQEAGLDPQYLGIEVTESTAMRDIDLAIPNLKGLHSRGVKLSIDDFGTGYSSLNYLKRFPLHALKIDQSFIRGIATDPDDQAIVNAIIAMGHSLQLDVIAEGVEIDEQLSFLKDNGCDEMQGFLFSKPLPPERLTELIVPGR